MKLEYRSVLYQKMQTSQDQEDTILVFENIENKTSHFYEDEKRYSSKYRYFVNRQVMKTKTDVYVSKLAKIKNTVLINILDSSCGDLVIHTIDSALATTSLVAFSYHVSIKITPDQIWNTVLSQHNLSLPYCDKKNEFVADIIPGAKYSDFPGIILNQATWIGNNLKDYVNSFSTTDENSKIASQMILLSVLSKSSNVKMRTACGIPSVYMAGTLDDYKKIKEMAKELINPTWFESLQFLLDAFIEAKSGIKNDKFWRDFVSKDSESGKGPNIDGNLTLLFPNTMKDNNVIFEPKIRNIDISSIPANVCSLSVPWDDFGNKREIIFCGGTTGNVVNENYITTEDNWIVAENISPD